MNLDRLVLRENTSFPEFMTREYAQHLADSIPLFPENDPKNPEWNATPILILDLTQEGYGIVQVKDEGDPRCNPTQTIKDRPGWEYTAEQGAFGREVLQRDDLETLPVPAYTLITSGKELLRQI